MSKRKLKVLRIVAMFMLISILNQLFLPSISYALTSGSTQPEIWGYQPVDATDNVSLTSGSFNYTIPITSIPEFPMAIGYNANLGMDQEASAFGFGFNGFSGAITRSVNGLPDDLKGGTKKFSFENQTMIDQSGTFGVGVGFPQNSSVQVGASVSLTMGYNNYNGCYGAIGLGVGVKLKTGGFGNPTLGEGLYDDSRDTKARVGICASASLMQGLDLKYSGSESADGKKFQNSLSLSSFGNSITKVDMGKYRFPSNNAPLSSTLAPLAYVFPTTSSKGTSLSVTVPIPPTFAVSLTIAAQWSKYKLVTNDYPKTGYGFMYLSEYDRSDESNIADMTIEGENSFSPSSYNNPSYLQKDNYNINTMGLSGGMELYQKAYGVVSRNSSYKQTRLRSMLDKKVTIEEVHPWVSTKQLSINKSTDIISILKSQNVGDELFSEKSLADFNGPNQKFDDKSSVFKMRGDYAGEYDLASGSSIDHDVNPYSLIHIPGTSSNPKFAWLGVEKNVPLYYPVANRDYNSYATNPNHKIERSTQIIKHTINDILTSYASLIGPPLNPKNPNATHTNSFDPFNFNQSFYSHYNYVKQAGTSKSANVILNDHIEKMNILQHLSDLRSYNVSKGNSSFNDLIGSIEVENVNGLRYYFNLPVFNKTSKNLQMQGKGHVPPDGIGGVDNNYHSFCESVLPGLPVCINQERNKMTTEDKYMYPYAWLLTAVVGDDYIDYDNIPGPSDGDIGYWVKFKYVKAADDYQWRFPFTGMSYYPGIIHQQGTDSYSVSSGTKEIYYLSEVESSNYVCKYKYQKRFDGVDATLINNGQAYNTLTGNDTSATYTDPKYTDPNAPDRTGDNFQFAVTQIDLYKKHTDGNNSSNINETTQKIIKSTQFSYDYSTCPGVPNNYVQYAPSSILIGTLPYHDHYTTDPSSPIKSGKLTLRKVQHIAYDESGNLATATLLPSYNFSYYGDNQTPSDPYQYNPPYDPQAVDQWGNYVRKSKALGSSNGAQSSINYYEHYGEYVKSEADDNAKVYKLKTIQLPSGGSMDVNYEAKSYGYVEEQNPYVMRHVKNIIPFPNDPSASTLTVDVTDLVAGGCTYGFLDQKATTKTSKGEDKPILKRDDQVYGEMAFYRSTKHVEDHKGYYCQSDIVMINEDAIVVDIAALPVQVGDHYYQDVTLQGLKPYSPFINQCETFMYGESEEMRAIKDKILDPTNHNCSDVQGFRDDYENAEKDSPTDALRKVVAHAKNMFKHDASFQQELNSCFWDPDPIKTPLGLIYDHWSFLRTPIYKAKYTGAVVKSIVLRDGFNYATQSNGTDIIDATHPAIENEYGTNYYYDVNGDGTGTSAGVATVEPGGGKSCVKDIYAITGSGFMQSPNIISSKTTLENLYHNEATSSTNAGDKISRKKGKTSYEFYTPKEQDLKFGDHFKEQTTGSLSSPVVGNFFLFGIFTFFLIKFHIFHKTYTIKIPRIIPVVLKWKFANDYHMKSYAYTDYSDMYGKLKSVHQLDASGQELGTQQYNYYGLDDAIPVYKNAFTATPETSSKRPGKMDQTWSEAYYAQTDDIKSYVGFIIIGNSKKDFCYTNMKYSYIPPVLKEVVSKIDGLTTTTSYTGFDYYTGTPIQTQSQDSYENTKISQTVPAYWKYSDMGPRVVDDWIGADNNALNNLTASTGTYMFLYKKGEALPANGTPIVNTPQGAAASHLIGAGIVKWVNGIAPKNECWNMISYLQPNRNFVSETSWNSLSYKYSYNYTYNEIPGNFIKGCYNQGARDNDKSNGISHPVPHIQRNASIYKAFKGYTYETPLKTDGSGEFKSFIPFIYSTSATNPAWKLLSTNSLYAENGVLVQSTDVLSKYASQLLGYNFSNTMAAVSNASWGASAYEGAENTYQPQSTSHVGPMLESNKVKLLDANVIKVCDRTFVNKTLCFNSTNGSTIHADALTVTLPSTINHNVPFAKLQVIYFNGISRTLFVSLNDNNDFQIMSNQGESFDGFILYPQINGSYKLLFNHSDFSSVVVDATFTPVGYTASFTANQELPYCFNCINPKPYQIPENDCEGVVHTGSYAFTLDPNKKGTDFLITASGGAPTVTQAEFTRKYKALVWVHNSSPNKTELVMQITNASGVLIPGSERKTSKATPYVVAGDWTLLRLDFDLSNLSPTTYPSPYVHLFVRNSSATARATYDDYRVLPFNADMTNWVFDHQFNRVVSGLDIDNFASYSAYDNRGRVVESSVELQDVGKKTVQKFLYNDQKTN